MANEYFNRYQFFTANDQQNTIPYITIPAKVSDKKYVYKLGVSRLDKVSQLYYDTPYFGWFILQSNPQYGGSELNIPDNAVINVPFPLTSSLLDYKSALERYFYYYGEQ